MSYSELSAYYADFNTGYWKEEDAESCPCHGRGWALSQVDTWHKCPVHYQAGQAHPATEDEPLDGSDYYGDRYDHPENTVPRVIGEHPQG